MINYSFSNGRAVVFSTSTNKYFLSVVCNWINHCQWNDRFEKSTNNRTSRIHDPLYMYNIYIYKIYIIYIYKAGDGGRGEEGRGYSSLLLAPSWPYTSRAKPVRLPLCSLRRLPSAESIIYFVVLFV